MATTIDLGDGLFIAGDPDAVLGELNHWCEYCRGDGLDVDDTGELMPCYACAGFGQLECADPDCEQHRERP
ncbi:hypothetical protein [Humibacter sp. RRB41]|uniref:hypothetical protein n=1 Tax=Humibacter sp. RRB41 TaxID=2919946 RepID=UPI001FA9D5C6|nr:hypothetical protein [Humibacter sp. RRB41]